MLVRRTPLLVNPRGQIWGERKFKMRKLALRRLASRFVAR